VGHVIEVGEGFVLVEGLPDVSSDELLLFPGGERGMAFDLDRERVGVILLDSAGALEVGGKVRRTGRLLDVPVGEALLGRVVDPAGRPLDGAGPVRSAQRLPIEREAPAVLDRAPVQVPLQTGIKVIDALIPVGRGQRELILGDRQTGKTAIALDAILNQEAGDVVCVYCAIAQRSSSVASVVGELRERGALESCTVVATTSEDLPGLCFAAPYAAASMAEFFMEQGRDTLVVFDDLTRHARAYRELSLLLRRPPGREAYPGDIFYIHARLLERATRLHQRLGGGSMTALPIVETQAQNIAAYIPTNLISITDGQIYLTPKLFQRGVLPAVDVGRSVSRVGGKAQLPAYQAVAGDLRLAYAQFEELERFARYGTHLEEETRAALEHGRRIREVLKQSQYQTLGAGEQIVILLAASEGLFDRLHPEQVAAAETAVRKAAARDAAEVLDRIEAGARLDEPNRKRLLAAAHQAIEALVRDGPRPPEA
jgi:F-type H+-transporting ATPase subunit alpha